jgi:cell division protein FtsB
MRKLAAIIVCTLSLNACAILQTGDDRTIFHHDQEKKLAMAIKLQNEGKLTAAVELLIALCAEQRAPGVTDEALFRLSLLYLGNGKDYDKGSLQLAKQAIERLRKEYPSSSWAGMAAPLAELLTTTAELRRQNQNLKNQNQALTRENQTLSRENQSLSKETQELRQNIEKLKRLDLELEKKSK